MSNLTSRIERIEKAASAGEWLAALAAGYPADCQDIWQDARRQGFTPDEILHQHFSDVARIDELVTSGQYTRAELDAMPIEVWAAVIDGPQ